MNADKLRKVADAIESGGVLVNGRALGFDMSVFYEETYVCGAGVEPKECGTAACVAGWTVAALAGPEELVKLGERWYGVENRATELLELDPVEAVALFFADYSADADAADRQALDEERDYRDVLSKRVDPKRAAQELRALADRGEVDPRWLDRALA